MNTKRYQHLYTCNGRSFTLGTNNCLYYFITLSNSTEYVFIFLFAISISRQFLQDVLTGTLNEMNTEKTFTALIQAVSMEKDKKAELQNTILKYVIR